MTDHLYVVVNLAKQVEAAPKLGKKWHYVMPGEEPHTYDILDDAIEQVAALHQEFDHDLTTACVFELVRVPNREMQERYDQFVASMEEEDEN